jgi:alkylation response protein AidB-like acyl-CoA dehydrogenase
MPFSKVLPPADPADEATDLRHEVRTMLAEWFSQGDRTPHIDGWVSGWDPELSRLLAVRGWVGMAIPVQYGGQGRSPYLRHIVAEELVAAGAPVAFHWFADRQIAPALLRYGNETLRRYYLPRIAAGAYSFALGLSEPEAGSDLGAVRTSARKTEGGWLISGVKVWTSNAHRADSMTVLARDSSKRGEPNAAALSQFIVDLPSPGVTVRPIRQLGGAHHFNEVELDEAFVADDHLLGTPGEGWRQVTSELAWERSGPERFLSTYPLFSAAVDAYPGPDGPQRDHERRIGETLARFCTMHHLSLRVAAALARGETPAVAAALVKDLGTTLENDVIDAVAPLCESAPEIGSLFREAVLSQPGFTLRGGSTEVLRGIVAREVTGR